jgi:uncharacterized membrane protein YphA (DoxX/SURF4 family)
VSACQTRNPSWLSALFGRRWLLPTRAALVSAYVLGGVTKLAHFHAAVAEQEHFGLHPGWLWAALAIVVELGGSVCVMTNRLVWLGAGGLGCLTAVAMLVANDFWNVAGAARFSATNSFFEHLGLIAALVMAVRLSNSNDPSGDIHLQQNP